MARGDKLYFQALKEASKNTEIGDSNALELLNRAIDKGNSKAQYALATWYLYGKTVKKDYKVAVKLLFESSLQNNELACFDLAVCYENGFGIKKNMKKLSCFILRLSYLVRDNLFTKLAAVIIMALELIKTSTWLTYILL